MSPTAAEVADRADRPAAPVRTVEFRVSRPQVVGPNRPQPPFPISLSGPVQHGFGRGGKDLGCPTANLPDESIIPLSTAVQPGVYYGYAQVLQPRKGSSELFPDDFKVFPMVMSLGWNPFFKNERLTAEIHIMHEFRSDFYGYDMRALVLGYIRPELDYTSREALIEDIETDKVVALNSLTRPEYQKHMQDPIFELKPS